MATLEVRATDDPPPKEVSAILVTVKDIEVNLVTGDVARGWITVVSGPKTFDLVKITGIEELLGTSDLTPGQYSQIRLNVEKVDVTIEGTPVTADVPSGKLRIPGRFTAVAGETTVLTLDFDAGKSVVVTGKKKVIVKPVLKLLVRKRGEALSAAIEAPPAEPIPTPEPIATPVPISVPTATPQPSPTPTPTSTPTPVALSKTLSPSKDNTLYQDATGSLSNGKGEHFFVGSTSQGPVRRGVIHFDISSNVPAGAKITGVRLTLNLSRTQAGPQTIELHKLLADWGEGTSDASSNEGSGTSATVGDATWVHTFSKSGNWKATGGDFSATVSASTSVAGTGKYTWGPTPQLVADVQAWLDNPSSNFGWLLKGNEAVTQTTKRFDSRENTSVNDRPVLIIDFTPKSSSLPPKPGSPSGSGYD